ncbi:Metaxin-3 [Rhizophlyctis rosea]|nr:Metaxin-3 [Rhizophlyctis rosea]
MAGEQPSLELFSWGPAWDLPTCDPFCLSVEAYLNLTDTRWKVHDSSDPKTSPTGELPLLKDGVEVLVGTEKIFAHLKKKGADLDDHLNSHQRAESLAFITMIEQRLHDALLYTWWLETENFTKSTRPAFSRVLSWTSRYYVPSQIQNNAQNRLGHYGKVIENDKEVSEVYSMARECYRALAAKLGQNDYFFGNKPSTLDAVAFGHLAFHAYPSLAEPKLFSLLTFEFPSLIAYVNRMRTLVLSKPRETLAPESKAIWQRLSELSPQGVYQYVAERIRRRTAGSEGEGRVDWQKILSVVGAVGFFSGFIWYNGIIQIKDVDEGDDDDDE